MRIFIVLLSFVAFLGCEKPNPEPEKLDPIYSEMDKEAHAADTQMKQAEKDLEGFKKDLIAVVPQTGQIKYAQKRIAEAEAKIEKFRQLKTYFELRKESRKAWAREKYMKAYNKKEAWPPPEEYQEYLTQKKLEDAPRAWNVKQRLEQAKLGIPLNIGAPKTEEAKK